MPRKPRIDLAGYHHVVNRGVNRSNLSLHLRTDAWKQKFDSLNVLSRVGDTLPSASLKEESYNTYFGVAWRF